MNKHLEIKLRHTFKSLYADSDDVFAARLTDLRATYQFDVLSFLRLSVIYNNTSRNPFNAPLVDPDDITSEYQDLSMQLLYAYKINPQTVFYLGYSEHSDDAEVMGQREKDLRSVFMKFSYAWLK